jgi:hypothetical protein
MYVLRCIKGVSLPRQQQVVCPSAAQHHHECPSATPPDPKHLWCYSTVNQIQKGGTGLESHEAVLAVQNSFLAGKQTAKLAKLTGRTVARCIKFSMIWCFVLHAHKHTPAGKVNGVRARCQGINRAREWSIEGQPANAVIGEPSGAARLKQSLQLLPVLVPPARGGIN